MKDLLIVDGYNIINQWPELKSLYSQSMEKAREKLIEYFISYRELNNCEVIVVFDGKQSKIKDVQKITKYVSVIFSSEDQTADTVIEKIVYDEKKNKRNVFVATSDLHQQFSTFGNGAARISAREIKNEISSFMDEVKKDIKKRNMRNLPFSVEDMLPSDVVEKIRKKL